MARLRGPNLHPDTLPEIGCDLLAASIYDYAYLFALCQEIIGIGLEELFVDPFENYDLRMAAHLENTILAQEEREWYYRLRMICVWLRVIDKAEARSPFAEFLLTGIEKVLDSILDHLCGLMPANDANTYYWKTLTNRMCKIVQTSEAAQVVRDWREDKRTQNEEADRKGAHPRTLSRHLRRLPNPVRWHLYNVIMVKKTYDTRPLHFLNENKHKVVGASGLRDYFEKFYFGQQMTIGSAHDVAPPIFRHLHDIPWETHLLRAIDFVHRCGGAYRSIDPRAWIKTANFQTAPGRGLYQIALEFNCWIVRSPFDRLSAAIRVLDTPQLRREGRIPQNTLERIDAWLGRWVGGGEADTVKAIEELYDCIKRYRATYKKRAESLVGGECEKFGPSILLLAHPASLRGYAPSNAGREDVSLLEYLQGHKLEELLPIIQYVPELLPLTRYLELRHKPPTGECHKNDGVLQELLQALSSKDYSPASTTWQDALPDLQTHSLTRIAIAGSQDSKGANPAAPSFKKVFSQGTWHERGALGTHADHDPRVFHSVLGSHDIISMSPSRPMRRWLLPRFLIEPGGKSNPAAEQFLPFFERRERAIPVRHSTNLRPDWPDEWLASNICPNEKQPHILGFLSIYLGQRALRLDFLWRLLRSIKDKKRKLFSRNHTPCLDEVGGHFTENDRIFLAQGWGDILIAFEAPTVPSGTTIDLLDKLSHRLDEIFRIQNTLYQDFMVDRTELILSPTSLQVAAHRPNDYQITTLCRSMENRDLVPCNDKLIEEVRRQIGRTDISLWRTPGRTDFTLVFNDPALFSATKRPLCDLLDIFGSEVGQIDEFVTTVGYRAGGHAIGAIHNFLRSCAAAGAVVLSDAVDHCLDKRQHQGEQASE